MALTSISPAFVFFGQFGLACDLFAIVCGFFIQKFWAQKNHKKEIKLSRSVAIAATTAIPSFVFFIPSFLEHDQLVLSVTMILGVHFICFITSGFLFVTTQRIEALNALEIATLQEENLVLRLQQEEWFERERLARIIHGQVQSKILVGAIKLATNSAPSDSLLMEIKEDLQAAIDSLDQVNNQPSSSFAEQFQTIVATWEGICSISLMADSKFVTEGIADPVARACVIEIIREGVANATKHSNANHCEIILQENSSKKLEIDISCIGELENQTVNKNGYGTQLMNSLASSWEIRQEKEKVILSATVETR
jgi:signal transduction histidine kinase